MPQVLQTALAIVVACTIVGYIVSYGIQGAPTTSSVDNHKSVKLDSFKRLNLAIGACAASSAAIAIAYIHP